MQQNLNKRLTRSILLIVSSLLLLTACNVPVISSTPTLLATVDELYEYKVIASVADNENPEIQFSLETAPAGMSIDNLTGEINWTPDITQVGEHSVIIKATDAQGGKDTQSFTITVTPKVDTGLPDDLESVASPLSTTEITTLNDAVAFLYQGDNPIQTGMSAGTIIEKRVAIIRGTVLSRDNAPLTGVTVTIKGHAEFGLTLSRVNGMFDMVVNGGGTLTVNYEKTGYLPVQRKVTTSWNNYAIADDIVMIALDSKVTTINVDNSTEMQVAQGTVQTDKDGSRQATLFFPQGTNATMIYPSGFKHVLTSINVRATEYTVGENGFEAMPGSLPPSSAYTYAVELSVDEAISAGATHVEFSQAIPFYVDNFLNFPVGEAVPAGYYDRQLSAWIASDNGVIIKILAITAGLADIDIEGDGVKATSTQLSALGISDAERERLAQLYSVGKSLWRTPITHFTPWDCNWPYGPPDDAEAPPKDKLAEILDKDRPADSEDENKCSGCIISPQGQTLGEFVPITGTPFSMHYQSDRTAGYKASRSVNIPLSGDSVPASLESIELSIDFSGRRIKQSFVPQSNLDYNFVWDGLDGYGRKVLGSTKAKVTVTYIYPCVYRPGNNGFGQSSSSVEAIGTRSDCQSMTFPQRSILILSSPYQPSVIGGWSMSAHNFYNVSETAFYGGNGDKRTITGLGGVINTVAGNGSSYFSGDGDLAIKAGINFAIDITFAAGGELYISDMSDGRIRKVGADGIITTVAGSDDDGYSGDGGFATKAKLHNPLGIAIAEDGSLYIADYSNHRVRKVDPNGIITTVAGTGDSGYSGDGGLATQAKIWAPAGIAFNMNGSLYISDIRRIRKIGLDGIITTVAGNGSRGNSGDGGLAIEASFNQPVHIAVSKDGNLYISDQLNNNIRLVKPSGIISTIAGGGSSCSSEGEYSGDGGLATEACLNHPQGIVLNADGSFYINDDGNRSVRLVDVDGIISTVAGIGEEGQPLDGQLVTEIKLQKWYLTGIAQAKDGSLYITDKERVMRMSPNTLNLPSGEVIIPSRSGNTLSVFNPQGRHLRTVNATTGSVIFNFGYTEAGLLSSVTDSDGDITNIERLDDGTPLAIIAPNGQRTELTLDSNGYLDSITNPAGESHSFIYSDEGLMTQYSDPKDNLNHYQYDEMGLLLKDTNPEGGGWTIKRTEQEKGYSVSMTSGEGIKRTFAITPLSTGGRMQTNTAPDGTQQTKLFGSDSSETISKADGSVITVKEGPDPRFSMLAPVPVEVKINTPLGLTYSQTTSRTAELADNDDKLSHTKLTESVTVNGKVATRVFDRESLTYTTTTPEGRETSSLIDNEGRLLQSNLSGLNSVNYLYDIRGRMSEIIMGDRSSSFNYDGDGNLASVVDATNREVSYLYDAAGRVTQQTQPNGQEIVFNYDANSNITSITPANSETHSFAYNQVDKGSDYTPPNLAGVSEVSTQYSYNLDKQLTVVTLPDGQKVEHIYHATTGKKSQTKIPRGSYDYLYKSATGQLEQISAPDGTATKFSYDGSLVLSAELTGTVSGKVNQVYNNDFSITKRCVNSSDCTDFVYDNDLLLTQAGSLSISRYAQKGGLINTTTLGGISTTNSYNNFGEILTSGTSDSKTYSTDYKRDKLGRITQLVETVEDKTTTFDYSYDLLGQLSTVKTDNVLTASYDFDDNGNRTHVNGIAIATIDAQDRLKQYGTNQYIYSDNGDLVSKTDTAFNKTSLFHYDVLGNLISAAIPDELSSATTQLEYVIDGQNRRIGKKVNGTLQQGFLYKDQLNVIAELDGTGEIVSRFVYGSKAFVPDYMEKGGKTYRILSNHLGSPRLVIDTSDNSIAQRIDYDVWGNITLDTNPGFQPFGFAGGLYDQHTKLTRFGARDYDAQTGRWTTKDPIGLNGGLNVYGYAGGDPVNLIDPLGLRGSPYGSGGYGSAVNNNDYYGHSESASHSTGLPSDMRQPNLAKDEGYRACTLECVGASMPGWYALEGSVVGSGLGAYSYLSGKLTRPTGILGVGMALISADSLLQCYAGCTWLSAQEELYETKPKDCR